ncbi:MAG: zinc-ribbon domain-containing protein, partial [Oscillospiraceae bacterium]|nr:zinc-ribbon domain-containing protein [Oscillospiraceae bacterium]
MAFCGKCGTQYEPGVKFCPGCGAATDGAQPVPGAVNDSNDIQSNKVMAILAYFGPLVLIPILAAKGSKFARYHSNQGLVLLLLCIAYSIVISILSGILLAISWRLS